MKLGVFLIFGLQRPWLALLGLFGLYWPLMIFSGKGKCSWAKVRGRWPLSSNQISKTIIGPDLPFWLTVKEYTFKQFKKFGVHKATIYRWLKKIEQKLHMVNQNGLQSLQKIWNELNFMFVIYSCQKIEYRCIFYNDV